jgi:hypothetical protein
MLGAIQFDFPIRRPNYRFANEAAFPAVIGTFVPADGACVVRASVDVNHVGHNANHTADWADKGQPWLRITTLNLTCPVCAASSTGRCNTIQCIDSTMVARENHLFGSARSKPSQSGVPGGLTLAGDFSLCFQCQAGSSLVLRRPIEITRLIRR